MTPNHSDFFRATAHLQGVTTPTLSLLHSTGSFSGQTSNRTCCMHFLSAESRATNSIFWSKHLIPRERENTRSRFSIKTSDQRSGASPDQASRRALAHLQECSCNRRPSRCHGGSTRRPNQGGARGRALGTSSTPECLRLLEHASDGCQRARRKGPCTAFSK